MSGIRYSSKRSKRTKIVCTIGPASSSIGMIEKLARAGMDCARLNFSHGNPEEHGRLIDSIRRVARTAEKQIAIMQDLPGPKLRVGEINGGSVLLRKGSKVSLVTDIKESREETRIPLRQKDIARFVSKGATIFLSDGSIRLKVLGTTKNEINCNCLVGGTLYSGKGVNIPKLKDDFETFTDKDKRFVKFGLKQGVDFVAVSFVRTAEDITKVRSFISRNAKGEPPWIVAKIEKKSGFENIEKIVRVADCIMVARGDLGVENPIEQVPLVQKKVISTCNDLAVPVITATQMLESMVQNSSPTRAEVTDVANAILDGTDALMLSEETAVGKYPEQCVQMLRKISLVTEARMLARSSYFLKDSLPDDSRSIGDSLALSACQISRDVGAKVILTPTETGDIARRVSRFRPKAPITAPSTKTGLIRKLKLVWGVDPLKSEQVSTEKLNENLDSVRRERSLQKEDRVVIVSEYGELSGFEGGFLMVN